MVTSVSSTTSSGTSAAEAASGTSKLANSETFMKLLVAQIKNQNPLDPTDSTQFVAQLAQFSELEQTLAIRTDVAALRETVEGFAQSGSTSQTQQTA